MPTTRLPLDYGVELEVHDLLPAHYDADPEAVDAIIREAVAYGFDVFATPGLSVRVFLRHMDVDVAQEFVLEHGYELDEVSPACDYGHRVHRPACPACN